MNKDFRRSEQLAADYEATVAEFIRLLESLDDEQWRRVGTNVPTRMNDEDEGRTVGVIAHHVASSAEAILDRIQRSLDGRPLPQVDFREINSLHAAEHADVTRADVLGFLRESSPRLVAALRAISDDQLDQPRETPVGPMSIAERVERVLIGHLKVHQASIEAALSEP